MGAAQSIPIIGETVTVVESGIKLAGAGVAGVIGGGGKLITGEDNDFLTVAGALAEGAGNSWVEYSERNMIAAPLRCAVHELRGESEEAHRVIEKCVESTESFVDNLPVAGHVKGVVHYAAGDTEHGDKCMKGATRSLAVMGAGALTGGVGAGAVLAGTAAVSTGVGYDAIVTGFQSNDDKFEPFGSIAGVKRVVDGCDAGDECEYVNDVFDTTLGVMGDFLTGYETARAVENHMKAGKVATEKQTLKNKIGKDAGTDLEGAAKTLKKVKKDGGIKGDGHVITRVRNKKTGEISHGLNERARQNMRMKEFERNGKSSRYPTKTQAKKGLVNEFPRKGGRLESLAEQKNIKTHNAYGNRSHRACAEHHAFNKYLKEGASPTDARTYSVRVDGNNFTAVKRCDKCVQYGSLMGDVVSDRIHGLRIRTECVETIEWQGNKHAMEAAVVNSARKNRRREEKYQY